jgi:hypothetical protein
LSCTTYQFHSLLGTFIFFLLDDICNSSVSFAVLWWECRRHECEVKNSRHKRQNHQDQKGIQVPIVLGKGLAHVARDGTSTDAQFHPSWYLISSMGGRKRAVVKPRVRPNLPVPPLMSLVTRMYIVPNVTAPIPSSKNLGGEDDTLQKNTRFSSIALDFEKSRQDCATNWDNSKTDQEQPRTAVFLRVCTAKLGTCCHHGDLGNGDT